MLVNGLHRSDGLDIRVDSSPTGTETHCRSVWSGVRQDIVRDSTLGPESGRGDLSTRMTPSLPTFLRESYAVTIRRLLWV